MSEQVCGLRVAALLEALKDAAGAEHRLGEFYLSGDPIGDAHDAARDAYREAARLIRAHLGEPTPEERAAAEVLAHDASDIIPSDAPRILDEIAMEIEQAREYLGFARADRAGYRIARIARLALAGILACAAKGGA